MKHPVRFIVAIALALLLLGGLTPAARAFDIRTNDNIVIGTNEVIDDDLLIAGNSALVNGTVNGNLISSSSRLEINGVVNGTVLAAGQNLIINGTVRDSVYAAGASLVLGAKSSVGRNVAFGGFGVQTDSGSVVGRDLLVGGYQLVFNGQVARDLRFGGGALELNGKVGRDVRADVSSPDSANTPTYVTQWSFMPTPIPAGLRISSGATIGGRLSYTSPVDQSRSIAMSPQGGVQFQMTAEPGRRVPGVADFIWGRTQELLSLLVLGVLAAWLIPQWLSHASANAQSRPLQSFGWGLVWLIGGFLLAIGVGIAIIVLGVIVGAVTLGGLSNPFFGLAFTLLALAFGVFLLMIAFGAKLVCAHLIGRLMLRPFNVPLSEHRLAPLMLGIVVYVLVASIPWVDSAIVLVVTLVGLGAIWYTFRSKGGVMPASLVTPPAPLIPSTPRPMMG
jgi:hypothetical protein